MKTKDIKTVLCNSCGGKSYPLALGHSVGIDEENELLVQYYLCSQCHDIVEEIIER
jgi:uncharacterized protein YlaI